MNTDNKSKEYFEAFAPFLAKVQNTMKSSVRTRHFEIRKVIEDVMGRKGKMLRPILTYIGSQFDAENSNALYINKEMNNGPNGNNYEDVVKAASIIEMIHIATLVHDDLIDEAKYRRGSLTLHEKYGKDMALYTGDFLLSRAINLVPDLDAEISRNINKTLSVVCEGELLQYFSLGKKLTLKQYLKIIGGKTAALIAVSSYAGAKISGQIESVAREIAKATYYIGMCFQMIDDLLDFGDQHITGKSSGSDLKKGYFTLPVIMAYEGLEVQSVEKLNISAGEVIERKGLEKARKICDKYAAKARKHIEKLPNSKGKTLLSELEKILLNRNY